MSQDRSTAENCGTCGKPQTETFHYTVAVTPDGSIHLGLGSNLTEAETNERSTRFWNAMQRRYTPSETPRSAAVESLIGQLRKHVSHNVCEDAWYSCAQADCVDDRRVGHPCDCGAQHLNELHAHAADALERTVSAIGTRDAALEEAAAICDQQGEAWRQAHKEGSEILAYEDQALHGVASMIRTLKGKP